MQVMPTILEKNKKNFEYQLQHLSPYFNHFHIDIADQIFVNNKTISIKETASAVNIINNNNLLFDFHLMVKDYESYVKEIFKISKLIKIKRVFIHLSVNPDLQKLKKIYPEFSFGIVLSPEDRVKTIEQKIDIKDINSILIMTVNPGFQGSAFIQDMLIKVEQAKNTYVNKTILVDGGVNSKTLSDIVLKRHRPDILCVGSFLTKTKDIKTSIESLKAVISGVKI